MIYFLAHAGTNSVKIGYTRGPIADRLLAIQPNSPVPLELVATVDGSAKLEGALHAAFDDLRLHNEWFRLEGELRALVRRIVVDGPTSVIEYLTDLEAGCAAARHGTTSAYIGRRCRCDLCVAGWSAYQRARRAGEPLAWKPGRRGRPPKRKPQP